MRQGPTLGQGLGASHSPHPVQQKPQARNSVTESRVFRPLFSESPCPSENVLLLQLSPSKGRGLTTETQPAEAETTARRRSGITTSLSCQVRFWSSGSCSIGPLKKDGRLESTLTNQDAGWLSRGAGRFRRFPTETAWGSMGAWEFCGGLRLLCGVLAGRGFALLLRGWARLSVHQGW